MKSPSGDPETEFERVQSSINLIQIAKHPYQGVSKSSRTESITKYMLTTINTR